MKRFDSVYPERSRAKKQPARFLKNLWVPPIEHPPGAVPEAYQPKPNARNTMLVIRAVLGALVLFSA
jgi:hypothetical protein